MRKKIVLQWKKKPEVRLPLPEPKQTVEEKLENVEGKVDMLLDMIRTGTSPEVNLDGLKELLLKRIEEAKPEPKYEKKKVDSSQTFIPTIDTNSMSMKSKEVKTSVIASNDIHLAIDAMDSIVKEPEIKPLQKETHICDYGCGRPAIKQFANGRWCCSERANLCPAAIERMRAGKKS